MPWVKIKSTFAPDLKSIKKIITTFNLILFIGSLLFVSFNGLLKNQESQSISHVKQQVSAKQSDDNGCSQLVFEKIENESETENDLQSAAFILPFLISYLQFEVSQSPPPSAQSLAEVHNNPIYLSVCNFRI